MADQRFGVGTNPVARSGSVVELDELGHLRVDRRPRNKPGHLERTFRCSVRHEAFRMCSGCDENRLSTVPKPAVAKIFVFVVHLGGFLRKNSFGHEKSILNLFSMYRSALFVYISDHIFEDGCSLLFTKRFFESLCNNFLPRCKRFTCTTFLRAEFVTK